MQGTGKNSLAYPARQNGRLLGHVNAPRDNAVQEVENFCAERVIEQSLFTGSGYNSAQHCHDMMSEAFRLKIRFPWLILPCQHIDFQGRRCVRSAHGHSFAIATVMQSKIAHGDQTSQLEISVLLNEQGRGRAGPCLSRGGEEGGGSSRTGGFQG